MSTRLHLQRISVVPERQTVTGSDRISVSILNLSTVNTPDQLIWVQSTAARVTSNQPNSLVSVFIVSIADAWHPPASQINNIFNLPGCFKMSLVENLTGVTCIASSHSELVSVVARAQGARCVSDCAIVLH